MLYWKKEFGFAGNRKILQPDTEVCTEVSIDQAICNIEKGSFIHLWSSKQSL